jgi:HAD superfamily hydrolase (TIGR01549 family)
MATILFDFDGVLADTLDDLLDFAREACAQMGFQRTPTSDDLDVLETMSFVDYGLQLKLPPQYIDEFVSRCLQMFNQRSQPPKIFEGMEQVVVEAAKHNTIAIVTGNTTPTVLAFLEKYGLQKHIKLVIGVEQKVPRPEKIRLALKELGHSEEVVYMVGDALSDIRAARETSIKSIAVSWGHQSPSRLMTAGPDYLVDSPQELLELLKKVK